MTTTDEPEQGTGQRSLAKNFSMLASSQAMTFLLTVAATVVIPRFLGAAVIGRLQLATAIWALGLALIGFGMNLAVTKAVARDPDRIAELVKTGIAARFLLALPVSALLFLYAFLVGYSNQVLVLMIILGIQSLVQAVADIAVAVLSGIERVGAISAGNIGGRLVAVGGAIALLIAGFGVYAVAIFGVLGFVFSGGIQIFALRAAWRELGGNQSARVDRVSIIVLLRESQPYFWIAFLMIAYQQIDTLVISLVVENDVVLGWYSVYDRLQGTLMFIPTAFLTVVYPTLARRYEGTEGDKSGANSELIRRAFRLMLLVSVPAGFGLSVLARPIIELLYGLEFSDAAEVVHVGGIVISLTFLNTVFAIFLISMDKQKYLTIFIALSAILTIPLDAYLVPFFQDQIGNGAVGGVVAYAVTESIMLCGMIYLLPRGSLDRSSLSYAIRIVSAGLLMIAAVFPFRNNFLLIPIAIGAVVFVAAALILRIVGSQEKELFASLLPDRISSRL